MKHPNPDEKLLDELLWTIPENYDGQTNEQVIAKARTAILSKFVSKDKVREALKDDSISMVRANRKDPDPNRRYRYIKASDMPKYYRNKLRASLRSKLGIEE